MRVGLLSQWFDPEPGAAAVPGVLARELRDRGHQVRVVTGFPNYPSGILAADYHLQRVLDEDQDGITVRRVALYPSHDRSPWHRSANYLSFAASAAVSGVRFLRPVDAFWVYNSPQTVGLPAALVSARGGPPHLMHVVDLWPDSIALGGLTSSRTNRWLQGMLGPWCKFTYRNAAAVAAISPGIRELLVARGVDAGKVHEVPVWTDERLFQPRVKDRRLARDLGVDEGDSFVLMYAGNLGDAQGLDDLLVILARVNDLDGLRCIIAGSGTAEARLRAAAQQLGLSNVMFVGRWPSGDMGRLLSIGDLHVVSLADHALARVTYPSKLAAIFASGRPVLARVAGDIADVVRRAEAGWVVPPDDLAAYEQAVRDAYAAGAVGLRRVGANARRYYDATLSLSRTVDSVEGILRSIAERHASGAAR